MHSFRVISGLEATEWCVRHGERWDELHARCGAGNPYLSRAFAQTWYRHYGGEWSPVLVLAAGPDDALLGLLPLALEPGRRVLTGAGACQAEYHGWLAATPPREFLPPALDALFAAFPGHRLELRYLLDVANLEALAASPLGRRLTLTRRHRPLMDLDPAHLAASLKKKGNKSKLNRLKREGELEYLFPADAGELEAVFDEIIAAYDFRQGGAHDVLPFTEDPRKKAFHLDWMRAAPEQLRVACLRRGGRLIASLITAGNGRETALAINSYLPQAAAHSPAKLLVYEAGLRWAAEGLAVLDLTPGDDPWKDKMATRAEPVLELIAYESALARLRARAPARLRTAVKAALARAGVEPRRLRELMNRLRRVRPRSVWNRLRGLLPQRSEYLVYRVPLKDRPLPAPLRGLSVDSLQDLVELAPRVAAQGRQSRQDFLAEAARRLENGNRVYTLRVNGEPVHYRWLVPRQASSHFGELDARYDYPQPGPVCFDSYTLPAARGRGYSQRVLHHVLHDLARRGERFAYISVLADNAPSRRIIEKTGGMRIASLRRWRFLGWGRLRRREEPLPTPTPAPPTAEAADEPAAQTRRAGNG